MCYILVVVFGPKGMLSGVLLLVISMCVRLFVFPLESNTQLAISNMNYENSKATYNILMKKNPGVQFEGHLYYRTLKRSQDVSTVYHCEKRDSSIVLLDPGV